MKSILSLAALGLALAVTTPAFADEKADCEKKQGYEWDESQGKCVEESPGG